MPLSNKLVSYDLQEIARVLSRFRVGVIVIIVILCHDAFAVVALPIFPPNEL